jgi:hypothetical protein
MTSKQTTAALQLNIDPDVMNYYIKGSLPKDSNLTVRSSSPRRSPKRRKGASRSPQKSRRRRPPLRAKRQARPPGPPDRRDEPPLPSPPARDRSLEIAVIHHERRSPSCQTCRPTVPLGRHCPHPVSHGPRFGFPGKYKRFPPDKPLVPPRTP